MTISVVVTSCERVAAFRKLAERLAAEGLHQVVVMDNSKTAEARQVIAELATAHGFRLEQWPFVPFNMCKLRNFGLDAATGDIVVLLDSDIIPLSTEYFGKIRRFHEHNRSLLIHARYKIYDSTSMTEDTDGEPVIVDNYRQGLIDAGKRPWKASSSGNCSIRRDVLGDIRFDERYTGAWGWEDADWTREIWDSGIPLAFDNTICAIHDPHEREQTGRESNWCKFRDKWRERLLPRYTEACSLLKINPRSGSSKVRKYFAGEDLDREVHDCLKILEVGCGSGSLAHYLSCVYGAEVNALDPYDGHGHRTEAESQNEELRVATRDAVKIEKCRLIDYATPDRFDYAVADISLHHIAPTGKRFRDGTKEVELIVESMRRVASALKDGGKFIIVDVNPIAPGNVWYQKCCVKGNVRPGSKHFAHEWIHLLTRVGFENFAVDYFWPAKKDHPNVEFGSFAARSLKYAYKYRIVAMKGDRDKVKRP